MIANSAIEPYFIKYSFAVITGISEFLKSLLFRVIIESKLSSRAV